MGMSTFFNPVLSNTKKKKKKTLQQWPKTMKKRTDSGNYREGKQRCSRRPSHQKATPGNHKLNSVRVTSQEKKWFLMLCEQPFLTIVTL